MSVFNVADLTASMRLDKGSFDRDVTSVKSGLQGLADKAKSAGSSLGSALGGGLRAASGATNLLLLGTTALMASVVKTGVSYNILQQNSRAALTTLLGGAKEANAQMDKLDDFAKNSPFAKDVFIKAQQQLLAFGMEAEKVIPTMDAVQQAIAASGGSNADLEGVIATLAKVQSSGKITAEDLNELGNRGIDAATLMGQAFGKTGAEMREDITDGALGADDAIAALTEQMQIRFGGATDNVKKQMSGALDRVKGATRDIGSLLARPFVDPKGGGMAVTWTNQFADALRALESKLGPMAMVVMDRLSPAFVALTDGLSAAKGAIDGIQIGSFTSGLDAMSENAPGILGLSAAFLALSGNIPIVSGVLSTLGVSINPVVAGLIAAAAASPEFRGAIVDVLSAAEPLIPALMKLADAGVQGITVAFAAAAPVVSSLVGPVETVAEVTAGAIGVLAEVIEVVTNLPTPLLLAGAAAVIMHTQLGGIKTLGAGLFAPIQQGAQRFREEMALQRALAGPMVSSYAGIQRAGEGIAVGLATGERAVSTLGTASVLAGRQLTTGIVAGAGKLLSLLGGPWGIALMAGAAVLGALAGANAEAKAHVDALTDSLDRQSGAATADTLRLVADALAEDSIGFVQWTAGTKEVGESARILGTDLESLAGIVTGSQGDYDAFIGKIKEYPGAFQGTTMSIEEWAAMMNISVEDARAFGDQAVHMVNVLDEQRGALNLSKDSIDQMSGAQREAEQRSKDFAAALDIISDSSSTTSQKLSALNDALAVLNGVTPTADEAVRLLDDATRSLASDMVDAEGNVINFGDTIDAATGKINTKTEAGSALSASLADFVEKSKGAAIALEEEGAGAAAVQGSLEAARSEWILMAEQSGVSAETAAAAWDRMAQGNPGEITTIITADTTDVENKTQYANGMLDTIAGRSAVAGIWADDTVFGQKMAGAYGDLNALSQVIATATANLDPTQAEAVRQDILAKLTALAATDPTVKAMMDPADLQRKILESERRIRELSAQKATPEATAEIGQLRNAVATAQALIDGMRDKTVTITTNRVENVMPGRGGSALREASGGIVKAFANGGFNFQGRDLTPMSAIAQVVPSNTWRVVGDNITSPEMYVPMDGSARSQEILKQGVDMMGFALVPKNAMGGLALAAGGVTTTREGAPAVGVTVGSGAAQRKLDGDTYILNFHGVKTDDKEELASFLVSSIKHSRRGGVFSEDT